MSFIIKKATKTAARGRVALIGPSGSGKTWTALSIAAALGQRVCVIDTERGSASKYSDRFDFSVLELDTFAPATYVEALKAVQGAGFDVIVVDSLSHAWMGKGGALEMVDAAAARSNSRNSFDAWRQITPQHNRLVDALLSCKAHLVVTMRSKTEYVIEEDVRGKKVPRKVGLAPVQRDGLEYEFDVVGEMDHDHRLVVSKSRCSSLADAVIERPGEDLGATLRAWLTDGTPVVAQQPASHAEEHQGDDAEGNHQPTSLKDLVESIRQCALPGDVVDRWFASAEDRRGWTDDDNETIRVEATARVAKLQKSDEKAARAWLAKAIKERSAAKAASNATVTPRTETEQQGVLGSLTDAPDLTELRRRTVSALDAYPALSDAIWTHALAAAGRLGCDEPTFRRMVAEAMGDDPQPPAGGAGGSATGGKSSAHGKGASGAQGAPAARAANDVTELAVVSDAAQAILERHGANLWGLRGALKKHRDELRPTDVPELARVLAKITPPDPATKAVLTQVGAEKIVCGLTGLKRAA